MEAQASLRQAAESMRNRKGAGTDYQPHKLGDKVWLEGKNIKSTRPKDKLDDKRHGPFTVIEVLGSVTFKLDIPKQWRRVHPVFHANLLTRYVETEQHGPNFPEPPPDVVEEGEDYEVELVLDAKPTRNRQGVQYLVKWTGYPNSENQWVTYTELNRDAPHAIAEFYNRYPEALKPKNYRAPTPEEDSS